MIDYRLFCTYILKMNYVFAQINKIHHILKITFKNFKTTFTFANFRNLCYVDVFFFKSKHAISFCDLGSQ